MDSVLGMHHLRSNPSPPDRPIPSTMKLPSCSLVTNLIVIFACSITRSFAQDAAVIPDTRGPIITGGMNVVAEPSEGVEAPGYNYHKSASKAEDWQAKWINLPSSQHAGPGINSRANLFRHEISLDATPSSVKVRITAADYRLYINGKLASRGPADFGRDYDGTPSGRWFYDCRDLTPLFHKGRNAIAVEVFGGPGLIFEASAHVSSGDVVIASDSGWHCSPCNYLQTAGIPPDDGVPGGVCATFDGTQEPVGWQLPSFDDSQWGTAQEVDAPAQPLVPSEIPPLMEIHYPVEKITPLQGRISVPEKPFVDGHSLILDHDASFSVRFNRVMAAHWGIAVKGGAGARIYLEANETNSEAGAHTWAVVLRDGIQYFESPDYYSVGTIRVKVCHVTSPVEILEVSANYRSQPQAYAGSFTCSDPKLNTIWIACRWTTQINLQTHHLDSPQHQEPISDYGDYLIEDLDSYNAFAPNPWLARQDLRKWAWVMKNAHYRTFHTSYALLWLQALLNYYDYTGDKDLVEELAPSVHDLIDQFSTYIGDNGLLSNAPNYLFMDWIQLDGFEGHHPPAVIGQGYLTAFFYKALADASRVAELTGDSASVEKYTQLRHEIKAAYNRELWSPEQGLYRDGKPFASKVPPGGWLPADRDIETFTGQNNSLAVLYDLAPRDQQAAIMDKVLGTTPWNVRPYFMYYVFGAIAHAGLFDKYGTTWMRKWKVQKATQSFFEMGDQGDLSHGWTSSPLYEMNAQILGVKPAAPAFAEIDIEPQLCDLTFARGVVSTPHGNVGVDWERKSDQLMMTVNVPPGTQANLGIPVADAKAPALSADGTVLWQDEKPVGKTNGITGIQHKDTRLQMSLAPGTYKFVVSGLAKFTPPPDTDDSANSLDVETTADDLNSLESDVPKNSLVAVGSNNLATVDEEGVVSDGGATNADAVHNGTLLNKSGGADTADDGATFRGYGDGSSLTFLLNTTAHPAGYDLTQIATFAGHSDDRSGQKYKVSIALVSNPNTFVPLFEASASGQGGGTEIEASGNAGAPLRNGEGVSASHVAAIKFEFANGPLGFNVYREFSVVGAPSK